MEKPILILALALNALFTYSQDGPKGLPINAAAPLFKAKDQNGKDVSLKEDLKNGPVVLMFYRDQWCPYCNKQIKGMKDSLQLIL